MNKQNLHSNKLTCYLTLFSFCSSSFSLVLLSDIEVNLAKILIDFLMIIFLPLEYLNESFCDINQREENHFLYTVIDETLNKHLWLFVLLHRSE